MKLYLLRVISRTPYYDGPYVRETTYILPELLNINASGVFIQDNAPEDAYIQLPYIQLLAPFTVIQNIINAAISFRQTNPSAKFLAIATVKGQQTIHLQNSLGCNYKSV